MTEILKKIVVNCETGEVEETELTPEELAQLEADRVEFAAQQAARDAELAAQAEAKASAEAKLAAIGLTPEEIAALKA